MTLIGLWPTATAAPFESRQSSRIRRRANVTESKVRLVACLAAVTPPRRRFKAQIPQVGTIQCRKRKRKRKWRRSITLSGKSMSTLNPRETRQRRHKQFSKTKDAMATVFDVTEEGSHKTARIDLAEGI